MLYDREGLLDCGVTLFSSVQIAHLRNPKNLWHTIFIMKITLLFSLLFCVTCILSLGTFAEESYRMALLSGDLPEYDRLLAERLESELTGRGCRVERINAATLSDAKQLNSDRFDLLILPNSASLPIQSMAVIEAFLQQGGDLLALNAPAFTQWLWQQEGEWMSEPEWRRRLSEVRTDHLLFDFEKDDLSPWQRSTNAPDSRALYEQSGGYSGNGLHVRIENMTGWDTFGTTIRPAVFPEGHSLLCFYAKGIGKTKTLSLECVERDGSRWIAVFPVTGEWTRIVLTPGDFTYWESIAGRGQAGDSLNPANAISVRVGVALTHTGLRGGEYEYYIDELGTAPNPFGEMPREIVRPPRIEGVSPSYKFYPVTDTARIQSRWQPMLSINDPIPVPQSMKAHHPRPTGQGFNKKRGWRWIPVFEALGPQGEWRGAPVGIVLNEEEPLRGSVRAWFSTSDPGWYKESAVQKTIVAVAERMAQPVYLMEAGAEFFAYYPGEPITIGARVANFTPEVQQEYSVRFTIAALDDPGKPLLSREEKIVLSPGKVQPVSFIITDSLAKSGIDPKRSADYLVTSSLWSSSKEIDGIQSEFSVIQLKSESECRFVTTSGGDFIRDGKKWYVHGVNYMPSTGIGIEEQSDFEFWMGKRPYDPEFIQRDLERCRDLGLNSVSIFVYRNSIESRNLLDILRRCENLGLLVNLSIRPGTPMDYDWNQWKSIIEFNHLREWDVIYAYDIAWEPFFGNEPQRRTYDPQWREWIDKKYGSLENAEQAWGISAPRWNEQVTTPSPEQLGRDGVHRKMVADYRRFVDELIHQHYLEAKNNILSIDPNHLISFRMTVTGDPTFPGDTNMPYDFQGVAESMDFLAPEGYGRIGDWERIKPGVFTVAYARYCAPEKPVLWAEAGVHVWDESTMQSDPEKLEYQGRFYEDFYRMVLMSHSNGIVWWWYPGGYRTNERSDYGIINPDGTDRPNSRVIRRYAEKALAERTIPKPDYWISIDRDADARGLFGVYERVQKEFWEAIEAGKTPGLR